VGTRPLHEGRNGRLARAARRAALPARPGGIPYSRDTPPCCEPVFCLLSVTPADYMSSAPSRTGASASRDARVMGRGTRQTSPRAARAKRATEAPPLTARLPLPASLSSPVGVVESSLPLCVVEVFEREAESRSVTQPRSYCGALTSALRSRVGNVVELIRERASKLPYSFRQSVDGHALRPLVDSAEEEHFVRAAERNRSRRADRLEGRSYCVSAFKVTDLVEQLVAAAPR
jgi:hypothetical protein